jgi:hypothetical protein
MIDDFVLDEGADKKALHDVPRITALLQQAALDRRDVSYSELLMQLGFRFSRPKMRTLCKTLDEVDRLSAEHGQPELAVLVVREGDGLPGQGWWIGRTDYVGQWTGPEASAFIRSVQKDCFDYWAKVKGRG